MQYIISKHFFCRLSGLEVPQAAKLWVAGKYYMAIGQDYKEDSRDQVSQYVSGIAYKGTGMAFTFKRQIPTVGGPAAYLLQVKDNILTSRPLRWSDPNSQILAIAFPTEQQHCVASSRREHCRPGAGPSTAIQMLELYV